MKAFIALVSLAALALLAGFYSVVSGAVELSAVRKAESTIQAVVKPRQSGLAPKLVLVGSSSHDD